MRSIYGEPARGVTSPDVFVTENPSVPNIVCVCVDDMPAWMLEIAMPKTLLKLRDEGIQFTNAYVSVPLCGPDRATMFSGLYVHSHDCDTNAGCAPAFRRRGWEADSIAVRLARMGYSTGILGKWMNAYGDMQPAVIQGWNRHLVFGGAEQQSATEYQVNVDGRMATYQTSKQGETLYLAEKADLFLRNRNNERPYFLWIAPTAPHAPYSPTPANAGKFDGWTTRNVASYDFVHSSKPAAIRARIDKPLTDQEKIDIRDGQEGKLEELADVDDLINSVIQTITDLNRWRDTVLMFFSDNGFHFGEHRIERGKDEPYEESTKTPLLMRGVGIPRGITNSSLVATIDIPRTIAQLAGASSAGMEGRDLTPLMYNTASSVRTRMLVENPKEGWALLREGPWKFIDRYGTAEEELYNLTNTPYETVSVHADTANATLLTGFRSSLGALKACTGAACRTADA